MPETLTLYRVARDHNQVPDQAPRHLHWRTLDGALFGLATWWAEAIGAGKGGLWPPHVGSLHPRPNIEFAVVDFQIGHKPAREDDGRGYVAYLTCSATWKWRTYSDSRPEKIERVVDGITLTGWTESVRSYDEWCTAPIQRRLERPVPMETTSAFPIVRHVIEIGDEAERED
jgi:hypothetical protein